MGLFKKKTDYSYYSSYSSSRRRLKVGRTVIAVIAAVVVILGIIIYFNFNRIQFLMKGYSWSTTSELVRSFDNDEECDPDFSFKAMIPLAIATSIDALAIGVTFAFLNVNIIYAIVIIGMTTFIISMIGVKIGHIFGSKYKSKAEMAGGLILIIMGTKILLEHLGILNI